MTHQNLINLFIAECISADNNLTNESRKRNITLLKKFLENTKNNNAIFKVTKHQIELVKQGINLLQKEIEDEI